MQNTRIGRLRSALTERLRHRYTVPVVLAIAATLRVLAVLIIGQDVLYSDGWDYHDLAVRLVDTGQYASADMTPTAYRPVGYPAFLGALFTVVGPTIWLAQLANVVAQVLAFGLLWDVARKTVATELQAKVALLLMALHPNGIVSVVFLQTESIALFLAVLCIWGLVRWQGIVAGLAWGFLVLVKPPYLLLLPALTVWRGGEVRRTLKTVVTAAVVGSVIWGAWSIRNTQIAGHVAFVSSNAGANLRVAHNPQADGSYDVPPAMAAEMAETAALSEWEQSDVFADLATQWVADNPAAEATLVVRRFIHLWIHDADTIRQVKGMRQASQQPMPSVVFWGWVGLSMAFYGVMLGGAVVAVIRAPRLLTSPFVRVAVVITVVHMAFFGSARFHFVPLLFLMVLVPLALGSRASRNA